MLSGHCLASSAPVAAGISISHTRSVSKDATISNTLFPNMNNRAYTFVWRVPEFWKGLETPRSPDCFDHVVTINRISGDKYWACTCLALLKDAGQSLVRFVLSKISHLE